MDLQLILTISGTALLTALLLYLFAPTAPYLRLLDIPDNDRKLHTGNIPLTGGISLYISLVVALYCSGLAQTSLTGHVNFWLIVTTTLAILVMLHAVDDIVELRAETRFALDALLALFICIYADVQLTTLGPLFGMGEVTLGRFAIPMTLFCFVASSNAFNMVDGIDSLCSGLAIIAFATLTILILMGGGSLQYQLVAVMLVVITALAVTYLVNLGIFGQNTRVFLGDSGARLIAFIIAIALIIAAQKKLIHPVMAYFPIAVPVCDCLVLMGTRMLQGRSPISGDRLHLHHLLLDIGFSATQTRRLILALAVVFSLIGVAFELAGPPDWVVSAFVVVSFWSYIGFRFSLTRMGRRVAASEAPQSQDGTHPRAIDSRAPTP